MTTVACGVLLGVGLAAATAHGTDQYPGCEYLGGQPGFPKRMKGVLFIDEKGVHLKDKDGRSLLSIPIETVAGARRSTEDGMEWFQTGITGFASLDTKEFVGVEIRTADGTSTAMFKVRKMQGAGMAAKIRFWIDKAKASANPPP